jgi:hypothetical protein
LEEIEPFTMVIVDWNDGVLNLFEFIWDETKKYFNKLKNEPQIWSSSTLYEGAIKQTRKKWFHNWTTNNEFNSSTILNFHHSEIGPKEQAIFMKRSYVETVSITSVKKENTTIEMRYEDTINDKVVCVKF